MLPRFSTDSGYKLLGVDRPPFPKGRPFYVVVGTTFVLACLYLAATDFDAFSLSHSTSLHDLPPLYTEYHNVELSLPQQDWTKTEPSEGERFFFVAGHTRALGWGNAIQEHLLNAYLAYRAGRAFVFDNYTWNDDGSRYSTYNGHKIPSQIPYSAFIRGPMVGEPFPSQHEAPLAVSYEYFDQLCPKKLDLIREEVNARMLTQRNSASLITETWTRALRSTEDPCVQSSKGSGTIYTHEDIFGVPTSLLDIWPAFSTSPIIIHYRWSSLVELAFDINRDYFLPMDTLEPYLSSSLATTNAERYTMIPGLMAIHVRRGDYEGHCKYLSAHSENFVSVNAFPGMMDQFTVPHGTTSGNRELYRKRCYPTIDEIIQKVVDVRQTPAARGVRRLFIMTNGQPEFLSELKDALWEVAEWDLIASSRDMVLNWEQKYIAQAVDQLIAQRAQVLIGNGFSTLTSHAVMMRVANGFPTGGTRFW
ncbi:hypothetical protein L227DRAFT_598834 [Lentinus tigrinus ALCF2SS1-6]|uniref:O-fucosyltransferase family protein n=1 Tax=Lentinus tigrinus ALCF2SS1-6 TaxID=1328759 RepID=A0A5C2SIY6_9APHY|nr:hypothetical protein L227DRAFT_598834 [Lentinus tigrinus ALCF2SS1-6]